MSDESDDAFALFDSDSEGEGDGAESMSPAAAAASTTAYSSSHLTIGGLREHVLACVAPNLPATLKDLVETKDEGRSRRTSSYSR